MPPNTSADSKARPLVRESSRFTNNGGADHLAGCENSNPSRAIDDAERCEGFAALLDLARNGPSDDPKVPDSLYNVVGLPTMLYALLYSDSRCNSRTPLRYTNRSQYQ